MLSAKANNNDDHLSSFDIAAKIMSERTFPKTSLCFRLLLRQAGLGTTSFHNDVYMVALFLESEPPYSFHLLSQTNRD